MLYGRGDENAIVACQAFVEALRPCIESYTTSTLHQRLHGLEQDLAPAFPELAGRIAPRAGGVANDPEAERYRFFEAITSLLTGISAGCPTLLVLDDLHWADRPSVLLLRHIIRSAPRAALIIVACYREVEARERDAVSDLLVDLRREPFTTSVSLHGLTAEASAELLRAAAGRDVSAEVAATLHRSTGGNPFFMEELVRHLIEIDALPDAGARHDAKFDIGALQVPDGVREVIARRLRRLPTRVNEVLQVAAVVGPTFDPELIGNAAAQPPDIVLEALDLARTADLVREVPDRIVRYTFGHALIRDTLTSELGRARAARSYTRASGKSWSATWVRRTPPPNWRSTSCTRCP